MPIKNIETGVPLPLAELVQYSSGSVVSKTISSGPAGTITIFAFDEGQALSEHTAPFDALAFMIDGSCQFVIGGTQSTAKAGELVAMPANVPHALTAVKPFKMALVMMKDAQQ